MTKAAQSTYLFLLVRQSVALRREAAERLRSLGARVVAQYGAVAIEASATVQQADAAMEAGFFAARLSERSSRNGIRASPRRIASSRRI